MEDPNLQRSDRSLLPGRQKTDFYLVFWEALFHEITLPLNDLVCINLRQTFFSQKSFSISAKDACLHLLPPSSIKFTSAMA